MCLGPHEKPGLGCQASVPRGLFWNTHTGSNMWFLSHTAEPILSPEGTVAPGSCVNPSGKSNPAWLLNHYHIGRSPWIQTGIVTQQHETRCQMGPLGTFPQSQQIELAVILSCNGKLRRALQASIRRALLANLSIRGILEPSKRIHHYPPKGTLLFGAAHNLRVDKPPWPHEAPPAFFGHCEH